MANNLPIPLTSYLLVSSLSKDDDTDLSEMVEAGMVLSTGEWVSKKIKPGQIIYFYELTGVWFDAKKTLLILKESDILVADNEYPEVCHERIKNYFDRDR